MVATSVLTEFSFLASGPGFQVALPDYFDALPEMTTPLLNGHGGRSFDYIPYDRYEPPGADAEFLRVLYDPNGRPVELYRRIEPPPVWMLRWSLTRGVLATHLREKDGESHADVTVASLAIVEAPNGLPFLLPESPLRFLATSAPGYHEEVSYYSKTKGDGWSITFQRPGFAGEGVILQAPPDNTDGMVALRTGLGGGVEIWVWAGYDLAAGQDTIGMVLRSFSER